MRKQKFFKLVRKQGNVSTVTQQHVITAIDRECWFYLWNLDNYVFLRGMSCLHRKNNIPKKLVSKWDGIILGTCTQSSSSIFAGRLFDTQLILVSYVLCHAFLSAVLCPPFCVSIVSVYYRFFHQSFILDSITALSNGRRSSGGALPGSIAHSAASPGAFLSLVSCPACFDVIFLLSCHED